jgi:ABC-type nitrate/sulfonate/bicarbonate transport system substrate-binding protein
MRMHLLRRLALVTAAALLLAACGGDGDAGDTKKTLRLGCFPNVTHAPALVGIQEGFFAEALGPDVELELFYFNAGPEAIESLFSGAIDATFIGPNPAINGYAQSNGEALRIIAGSTSGGAFLVVRPGIESVQDLVGTTLATPQLGNTQDVALRAWLFPSTPPAAGTFPSGRSPTPTPSMPSRSETSTAPGCLSPGPPASSRRAAGTCWSTNATCGPTAPM